MNRFSQLNALSTWQANLQQSFILDLSPFESLLVETLLTKSLRLRWFCSVPVTEWIVYQENPLSTWLAHSFQFLFHFFTHWILWQKLVISTWLPRSHHFLFYLYYIMNPLQKHALSTWLARSRHFLFYHYYIMNPLPEARAINLTIARSRHFFIQPLLPNESFAKFRCLIWRLFNLPFIMHCR